jgi:K+-transporting ATPase KdpF subunit
LFCFSPPADVTPVGAENSEGPIMENLIIGLIALGLFAYLFYAMVRPEKF